MMEQLKFFLETFSQETCVVIQENMDAKVKKLTSGTKRENPNLISKRTCSMMRIAASPGSIFHFPSTSYKHTRSTQLVHIDIIIRN